MLGSFPKDFSQVATSQGYFPKWQLPKYAIYQAAIFQVCSARSARPQTDLAAAFGSLAHPSRSARPPPLHTGKFYCPQCHEIRSNIPKTLVEFLQPDGVSL